MTRRRPSGFTLTDSVVVTTVAGMLLSLALPALQDFREVARRAQCKNNLKQIGLAMHNYHDVYNMFALGIIGQNSGPRDGALCQFVASSATCDNPGYSSSSAFTATLPFLDHDKTYNGYNFQLACCAFANSTSTSAVVKTFICPSNPRGENALDSPYYGSKPAPTDYVLSIGGVGLITGDNPFVINTSKAQKYGIPNCMKRAAGVFNVNRGANIRQIKDGTSFTFMIGESAGGPNLFVGRAERQLVEGGQRMDSASTKVACENPWSMAYIGSGKNGVGQGFGSVFGATAWNAYYDRDGKLTDPANGDNWLPYPVNEGKLKFNRPTWALSSRPQTDAIGDDGSALPSSLGSTQGFRSYHPGLAHFLQCDGAIRPFTDDADPKVLVGFSSIVGREQVGPAD